MTTSRRCVLQLLLLAVFLIAVTSAASADTVSLTTNPNITFTTPAPGFPLEDSAVLSGGLGPTGTLTFILVGPGGSAVDTETVPVNGNGTYLTPTGYTLNGVAGTYQWNATYSGDTNNSPVSNIGDPNERVTVQPSSTSLTTQVNTPTTTPGNPLKDAAVLAGGSNPTGTLTFTLQAPGGPTVDTETVPVFGNGTYATPVGYVATAGAGTYQWNATYSGDVNNNASSDIGAANEQINVLPSSTNLTTQVNTPAAALGTPLQDTAVLSGGFNPTGTLTFTLQAPGGPTVDTETVPISGNGTYATPVGYLATGTGTYQWNASYSGDVNNAPSNEFGGPNEQVNVLPSGTNLTTQANQTVSTPGSPIPLQDTAVLSGGFNPTGTITFTLQAPGGPVVDTETVVVNGDGIYNTPVGFTLNGGVGTYQWNATYSGDANNIPSNDFGGPNEQVTVVPSQPNLTTQTSGINVLMDSAMLAGGFDPTGTITFTLFSPTNAIFDTETVLVNGDGTYNTPTGFTLFAGAPIGIYTWDVTYSGDFNNNGVVAGAERVQVGPPVPEPGSLVLLASGLAMGAGVIRRRMRR